MKINNLTADKLRKSILQLAIQGKLVKQNPDDEPASELVKKIYAEKQKLIAEGKIKKDKTESYIYKGDDNRYYEKIGKNEPVDITDDLPFDIPDSWEWIRLKTFTFLNGGYAFKSEKFSTAGIRVIRISDFDESGLKQKDIKRYPYSKDLEQYKINNDDILMCMTGGTVGKSVLIKEMQEDSYINQRVALIRAFLTNIKFIDCIIKSPYLSNIVKSSKTSTNDNISMKTIEDFFIPLPPLAEQQRIVEKIESMEPYLAQYDKIEKQLTKLESEIKDKLKKSILQYAIQGKLVKQDPNDEPASVLLERIKAEKEQLIKEGKIKQDKNESFIYKGDDKNYYENLPENWIVLPLKHVVFNHGQKVPIKTFSYIDIGSIDNIQQKLNSNENIITADKAPSRARKIVCYGDILYSTVRPYLHNMCIVDKEFSCEPIASTGFAVFSTYKFMYNKYLFYYLLSPQFDAYANNNENSKGVTYPAINDDRLYKALICFPNIEEQIKIVNKIEKLINCIK